MNKEDKIIHDIYVDLYKNAIPQGDFEELLANATINEFGQKVIPYMDYEIYPADYEYILNKHLKGKRITKLKQMMIKNSIHLGVSPRFKQD